jgi:hypothetical protein
MEDLRIPKKMLTCNPIRRRNIGGPQLRWKDEFALQEEGTDQAWPSR